MALSRGELKGQVLRLLMKTAEYPGFYTDDKCNDAIQEAMDFVATEMFLAGEGWQDKMEYRTTAANQVTVDLPESWAMIKEVRYKFGDIYIPLMYDTQPRQVTADDNAGSVQFASSYKIVDNQFYFNPPLAEGGTDYLQIEFSDFPKVIQTDTDFLESHFNRCFTNFMKYRTASILAASIEKFVNPWQKIENDWYEKMLALTVERNKQSTAIREYGD